MRLALSDVQDLTQLIDKGGVLFLLVAAVVVLGWLVMRLFGMLVAEMRRSRDEIVKERDAWRTIALSGIKAAESATDVALRQVGLP